MIDIKDRLEEYSQSIVLEILIYSGDLQQLPGLDQLPHLEVPYPLKNGGQQLRHASGCCPVHHLSVT